MTCRTLTAVFLRHFGLLGVLSSCLFLVSAPSLSWSAPDLASTGHVQAIHEDQSLELEDGRLIRLACLEIPRPLLNGQGAAHPPIVASAQQALTELALNQPVRLQNIGDADRWNRLPAQVENHQGLWLQSEMLRRGLARLMPEDSDAPVPASLIEAEDQARQKQIGLWNDAAYGAHSPLDAGQWLDSRQVFVGKVVSVNTTHTILYVNFSDDWRQGLSLKLSKAVAKRLPMAPSSLPGHSLLVRGWVGKGLGPIIEIRHPEQIRLLNTLPTATTTLSPAQEP